MLSADVLNKITELTLPITEREGLKLYDLEVVTEAGRRVLRLYISKPKELGPVSVDDCYRVSQALSLQLDVEDPIPFQYDLEVSSPGLERKLTKDWHFKEAIGETLRITLDQSREFEGFNKKFRTFEATLIEATDEFLRLNHENQPLTVSRACVEKARIVFNFGRDKEVPSKSKKKGR
jgi:ribosome maturation factor RimP